MQACSVLIVAATWKMGALMKEIPLSRGFVALVSDEDYERVSQFKWHARPGKHTTYAQRNIRKPDGRRTTQLLHRFILGITDFKIEIDHRNRDGLRNTRGNLRRATHSQNRANSRKLCRCTSHYRGVFWAKRDRKWRAYIQLNGKYIYLGCFTDELSAALAFDEAARSLFGPFASCNFPPKKPARSCDTPAQESRATVAPPSVCAGKRAT
jgi:hypothetical protein